MRIRNLLLMGGLACVGLAAAVPVYASHAWSTYHWARTSNPMPLQVVDSVDDFWQFEMNTALGEWNKSAALNMKVTSVDDSSKSARRCAAVSGQIRVCNASYGNNGWLGLASINIDSQGHITQGTAKMNDSYSSYWADPNEKRHVMCQEVGHLFGLGHTSENGTSQQTCMDYSSDPKSISPNQHDYDQLASIYAHIDSYNSYAAEGGGGGSGGGSCNPNSPKCSGFVFEGGPPMGLPVQVGLHHEIWVAADGFGGYWVHHIRVAPGTKGNRFGADGH